MPRCPLCLSQAGTALPGDLESIGEMLVVKGRAYTKCTGQAQTVPPVGHQVVVRSALQDALCFVCELWL